MIKARKIKLLIKSENLGVNMLTKVNMYIINKDDIFYVI